MASTIRRIPTASVILAHSHHLNDPPHGHGDGPHAHTVPGVALAPGANLQPADFGFNQVTTLAPMAPTPAFTPAPHGTWNSHSGHRPNRSPSPHRHPDPWRGRQWSAQQHAAVPGASLHHKVSVTWRSTAPAGPSRFTPPTPRATSLGRPQSKSNFCSLRERPTKPCGKSRIWRVASLFLRRASRSSSTRLSPICERRFDEMMLERLRDHETRFQADGGYDARVDGEDAHSSAAACAGPRANERTL